VDLGELLSAARRQWGDDVPASAAGTGASRVELGSVDVTGIAYDSRRVVAGDLFCCLPGSRADGHDHAAGAVEAGASALLVERELDLGVPRILVPNARRAMGLLASQLHGRPSQRLQAVGVTGTNGKTSVVHLLSDILRQAGRRVAESGTLTGERTTPEAPDLQASLASWAAEGVEVVCMEVSSHALAQHRVDGTDFAVVAHTNLSRDHLDYHGTMGAYAAAKQRLLTPEFSRQAVVMVEADGAGRDRVASAHAAGLDVVALEAGDAPDWRGAPLDLPLPGRFAAHNAMVAAELALCLGVVEEEVRAALARVAPVPGRFESLPQVDGVWVVVDYAHTPEALVSVLSTAREVAGDGRVLCVFGCGGGRDRGKRAEMGRAADEGADIVVLTSDNPRDEPPEGVIADILVGMEREPAGAPGGEWTLLVEPDRRAAIAAAIARARPGDLVLVAGKGHERTQEAAGEHLPFDDREVAGELLANRDPGR